MQLPTFLAFVSKTILGFAIFVRGFVVFVSVLVALVCTKTLFEVFLLVIIFFFLATIAFLAITFFFLATIAFLAIILSFLVTVFAITIFATVFAITIFATVIALTFVFAIPIFAAVTTVFLRLWQLVVQELCVKQAAFFVCRASFHLLHTHLLVIAFAFAVPM